MKKKGQVTPDLFDECLDFFYAEFFPRERLAKASGLDRLMYTGARHIYSQWLAEGLSVALVDPGDGNEFLFKGQSVSKTIHHPETTEASFLPVLFCGSRWKLMARITVTRFRKSGSFFSIRTRGTN